MEGRRSHSAQLAVAVIQTASQKAMNWGERGLKNRLPEPDAVEAKSEEDKTESEEMDVAKSLHRLS